MKSLKYRDAVPVLLQLIEIYELYCFREEFHTYMNAVCSLMFSHKNFHAAICEILCHSSHMVTRTPSADIWSISPDK